jgi:hypothetical protein
MNRAQEVVSDLLGIREVYESELGDLREVQEHLLSDNALLQREIEDLDYLNIYELTNVKDIIPTGDRKRHLLRLRRLRHEHPLAKQAVKLILRFTLGKGIQYVVSPKVDPAALVDSPPEPTPELADPLKQSTKGIFPVKYADPAQPPAPSPAPKNVVPFRGKISSDYLNAVLDKGNDNIRDIVDAFWKAPENRLILTTRAAQRDSLDDVVTDGEKFFLGVEGEGPPYLVLSYLPVEEITHTVYDPDNRAQPVWYQRTFIEQKFDGENDQYIPSGEPTKRYYLDYRVTDEDLARIGNKISIPSSKKAPPEQRVYHRMVNPVWGKVGKRGVSELFASRDWFKVFKSFMEGRAAINEAAQSISYKRKIKGSPAAVARFKNNLGGLQTGYDNDENPEGTLRKLTRPTKAGIYDTNAAADMEWMKTDTGAAGAKEDAHMLLATAGAGVSTMVHYFGEGGDANLATAQSMELPMVKSFEDWQQDEEDFLKDLHHWLLRVATDRDTADEEIERIGFQFPPIITQDVVKHMTSWAQFVRDIAPNNRPAKVEAIRGALTVMGVRNIDGLMPSILADMDRAEQERQAQLDRMAAINPLNPAAPGVPPKPPVAGENPVQGNDPNTQRIQKGLPEKVANGPKAS